VDNPDSPSNELKALDLLSLQTVLTHGDVDLTLLQVRCVLFSRGGGARLRLGPLLWVCLRCLAKYWVANSSAKFSSDDLLLPHAREQLVGRAGEAFVPFDYHPADDTHRCVFCAATARITKLEGPPCIPPT
jgi:hypothetical protein